MFKSSLANKVATLVLTVSNLGESIQFDVCKQCFKDVSQTPIYSTYISVV